MKFLFAIQLLAACVLSNTQAKSVGNGAVKDTKAGEIDLTHFNLWTRQNPITLQELFINDVDVLSGSNYDSSKPTKIFAHGWRMNGYDNEAVLSIRDEFLTHEDCNFIAVDWEGLANNTNYYKSAANTQPVGILTGELIQFLIAQGTTAENIYVIGFSLGAHVAGKAGAVNNGILPRITGLDPAYPGFSLNNTAERLDITDAVFVDVMHTNSAPLLDGGLSFPDSIGHVDFWPNGGITQPGCILTGTDILTIATGCSHNRAPKYFAESINRGIFTSIKCTSYEDFSAALCNANPQTRMGLPVSTAARDNYYLNTFGTEPFAMG